MSRPRCARRAGAIAQTYSGAANQATEAWVAPVFRNVPLALAETDYGRPVEPGHRSGQAVPETEVPLSGCRRPNLGGNRPVGRLRPKYTRARVADEVAVKDDQVKAGLGFVCGLIDPLTQRGLHE